ncbi:MAG: Tat pathway signal protein [Nitrococcus mobilis]|nr:Tat pathway signal protein [Nitrococcus mobilis]
MNASRRAFLKGVALTGFAVAAPGFASGNILSDKSNSLKGGANLPIVALINRLSKESAFLTGIRRAQRQQRSNDAITVQRCDRGLGFLQSLQTLLHSGKPTHIVGLVDDASAAVIVDLARSAGVHLYWLGHHAVSAGESRHNILATDSGYGCGLRFAQQLDAGGSGLSLTEQSMAESDGLRRMAFTTRRTPQDGRWAVALGFALTSLAVAPTEDLSAEADSRAVSTPLLGNFVSFSFKT